VDLREVTDALYGLPHAEFTAARTAYVKAAKAEGQRDLATKIGKLRRPTAAAWLINQLAREQPAELARLADLGTRLRAAHHDVDGAAIRDLSRERQTLIGSLVAASRDVGRGASQPVSDAVVRELEDMFTAALAEADAAGALASGRLTTAKDLVDGVPTWPESDPSTEPVTRLAKPSSKATSPGLAGAEDAAEADADADSGTDPDADADSGAEGARGACSGGRQAKVASLAEARRNKARAELERLEAELADAERAGEDAQNAADTATDEETDARKAVARLRTELSNAERAEKEARESARVARRAYDDAERAVREARKRRDVAANRLAALGEADS
jgi:hypothetical protein